MAECSIVFMRPSQVHERLSACPVVYVPVGPLEWHGPHLPLGTDPVNAQHVALRVCQQTGGVVWPTLFWGTERERSPHQLESLGFDSASYVVGMDFPRHSLPSAYCPQEVFALLIRETLRQVQAMGARIAIIINGHGAENHGRVLNRLAAEFNHTTRLRVHVRIAFPRDIALSGSIGHAAGDETSLMMHLCPQSVDVRALPALPEPLRYADYGIVDGTGFDGGGGPGHSVLDDPRTQSSVKQGQALAEQTINEVVSEVRSLLSRLEEV